MEIYTRENVQHPGTFDLFVDGEVRLLAESMQVCDNVKWCLEHGEDNSECGEIAARIRGSKMQQVFDSAARWCATQAAREGSFMMIASMSSHFAREFPGEFDHERFSQLVIEETKD